jgi:hypothetical protein
MGDRCNETVSRTITELRVSSPLRDGIELEDGFSPFVLTGVVDVARGVLAPGVPWKSFRGGEHGVWGAAGYDIGGLIICWLAQRADVNHHEA